MDMVSAEDLANSNSAVTVTAVSTLTESGVDKDLRMAPENEDLRIFGDEISALRRSGVGVEDFEVFGEEISRFGVVNSWRRIFFDESSADEEFPASPDSTSSIVLDDD